MDPKLEMGTVDRRGRRPLIRGQGRRGGGRGAKVLVGNVRKGALYSPTVVDKVTQDMPLVLHETFGPVSPVIRFKTIDDAIRISNSTAYGLSSAVCTNRFDYITRFIAELEVGSVNVREVPGYRLELTPFGGIKDSGLGYKEGVQEAIKKLHEREDVFAALGLKHDAGSPCHVPPMNGARR